MCTQSWDWGTPCTKQNKNFLVLAKGFGIAEPKLPEKSCIKKAFQSPKKGPGHPLMEQNQKTIWRAHFSEKICPQLKNKAFSCLFCKIEEFKSWKRHFEWINNLLHFPWHPKKLALSQYKGNLRIQRLCAEKKAALLGCSFVKLYNQKWSWKLIIEVSGGFIIGKPWSFGFYLKKQNPKDLTS